MANTFNIQILGIDKAIARIRHLNEAIVDDVNAEVMLMGAELYTLATQKLQANGRNDQGQLLGGMTFVQDVGGRKVVVGNTTFYSPYIEFGTGQKVSVPDEWRAYAATFQGKAGHGNFDDFVDRLVDWLKRKGITPSNGTDQNSYEDFAFHIAVKILREGQKAYPFLYPAYVQVKQNLLQRIKTIIATNR